MCGMSAARRQFDEKQSDKLCELDRRESINPGWWPNNFTDADFLIPCPNPAACASEITCQVTFSEAQFNWTTSCASCPGESDFSNLESSNCYCERLDMKRDSARNACALPSKTAGLRQETRARYAMCTTTKTWQF